MIVSKEKKLHMLREMLRMRRFEQYCEKNFLEGKLQGFIHVGIGEEGIEGVLCDLRTEDAVCSTHRGHGVVILKGADPGRMFAELCGRATGVSKGRGGSMHMADVSRGILGTNGILGAGGPLMCGAALAFQLQGMDNVACCFFGDGSSNEGGIHEAMNMAAAMKLPVLFVCTNNLYGMWSAWKDVAAFENIADRGAAYGMPGVAVDGNDVLAVYEVATQAIERARRGEGPTLLELKTYRWTGHSVGMAEPWRTEEEVAYWKDRCPIKLFRARLLEEGVPEGEITGIEAEVEREIADAFQFALDSPFPELSVATQDVYTDIDVEVERA